jgi:CRP-like cAMP-binding protein
MDATSPQFQNRILAALAREDLDRLRPHLEHQDLPLEQVLYGNGKPIPYIHFLESGMASLVVSLPDGSMTEIGIVGREGLSGLTALFGAETATHQSFMQLPGRGTRIKTELFLNEMHRRPAILRLVHRYAIAVQQQVAQSAVCNARHGLQQRLARWLLMAHDRTDGNNMPLKHEFLAMMLGVRRAGVTVAAGLLQDAAAIEYKRGSIRVRNRARLKAASCECYLMLKKDMGVS